MTGSIQSNAEIRFEAGHGPDPAVADEYLIYAATRDHHWNLTGFESRRLHHQFEKLYEKSAQMLQPETQPD